MAPRCPEAAGRPAALRRLMVAVLALWVTGAAVASPWQGRPLGEVLEELRAGPLAAAGWSLVYSDELVAPGMRVLVEPPVADPEAAPRRLLDGLLAPHGLAVEEREPGVLVVVRTGPAGGVVTGSVAGEGGEALAGARVNLLAPGADGPDDTHPDAPRRVTGADGAFAFLGLAPGRYGLMARAEGHLGRWVEVEVVAGEARTVRFRLSPRPFVDDEIVVRPSRYGLFDDAPGGGTVLGRDEIDRLPHLGDDPFRLASLLPGTAGSDVSARFSVRGGRRDEVRVVVDGLEVYEPYHLRDYDGALSIVPARALEGMSLTTGAYPASRGDRMSGVLDLRTLRPPGPRLGPRLILGLGALDAFAAASGRLPGTAAGGVAGEGEAAGKGGTAAGDPGGWLLTGRRGGLDLAGDAVGDEDPDFWDALGKVEVPTALGRFTVRALAAGDTLRVDTRDEEDFERLDNEWRSTYAWVTHSRGGDRWLVETLASWGGLESERRAAVEEEEGGYSLFDHRDLDVYTLSQEVSWQGTPRRLTRGGWEARRYRARFDYDKDLELDVVVEAPFSAPRSTRHAFADTLDGDDLAAWVSHREVAPADGGDLPAFLSRLTAELGLRYDRHGASDGTVWSPRLNLAWRLGEARVLRLAWGRFTQSQRPYELQVEDGETRLWPVEVSKHWVLGYEALLGGDGQGAGGRRGHGPRAESLRVELFHRRVDNPRPRYESLLEPLNFFPEVEPDRVRLDPEASTAYGAELLLQGSWGRSARGFLSYTWSRSEDRLLRQMVLEAGREVVSRREMVPRRFDQPHAVLANLGWRLPGNWDLNLAWRFHTGWPTTPVESLLDGGYEQDGGDEDDEAEDDDEEEGEDDDGGEAGAAPVARFGPLYSRRLPDYHRLDLRASRRWDLAGGTVTFYVDVQNAYDRANPAGFDLAVDDGRLEREVESWPGVVPTVGVVLELGRATPRGLD